MDRKAAQFAEYCKQHFNLEESSCYDYQSLSVCILDCVYSLRARYTTVTLPVIERYAALYMNGDRHQAGDTLTMLMQRMDAVGGPRAFADKVLKNHQVLGGKEQVSKENVCYQLAKTLRAIHVDSLEDFQQFELPELLEVVIRSVKGMGDAATNYLFMLAGDPERCKADVHIHRCVREACGQDLSNAECQELFSRTVQILKENYPRLTVRDLDGIIWGVYSRR